MLELTKCINKTKLRSNGHIESSRWLICCRLTLRKASKFLFTMSLLALAGILCILLQHKHFSLFSEPFKRIMHWRQAVAPHSSTLGSSTIWNEELNLHLIKSNKLELFVKVLLNRQKI